MKITAVETAVVQGKFEPVIRDGFIHLTEAPGHGLTLNENIARAHATPGTTFFGEAV